jgi:hypothetical protein
MSNRELPTLPQETLNRGLGTTETRTPFFPNQGSSGRYRFRPLYAGQRRDALEILWHFVKVQVIESNSDLIQIGSIWAVPFKPTSVKDRDMKVRQWCEFCAAICRAPSVRTAAALRQVQTEVLDASDSELFKPEVAVFDVWATYVDSRNKDGTLTGYSNLVYVCPAD